MEIIQESFDPKTPLDSMVQKLIILFVFDKMAIPLTEATIMDICTSENGWLSYMECKQYLAELIETNLVYRVPKGEMLNITNDGVGCLSVFVQKIPSTIRDEIVTYARENRLKFKKRQSYFSDYSKNADGSYTVIMRINSDQGTLMELKMIVSNRQDAKYLHNTWVDKASQTYSFLHDALLD
ncbi:MAG: DUF4364 family protein [Clostridia bacterium]|nr:DUF4364 family protein [Clostridia bacterium]